MTIYFIFLYIFLKLKIVPFFPLAQSVKASSTKEVGKLYMCTNQ